MKLATLAALCVLWAAHQHYGVESSYVLGQTVLTSYTLYKLTVTCGLRELSKLADCTSKVICTRVVKLPISQKAAVRPAYFTSCQNSFTCLHHSHLGSLCGKQTSSMLIVCPCHAMNVVCPWHGMALADPGSAHLIPKKQQQQQQQVYTYWSQMLKKSFTNPSYHCPTQDIVESELITSSCVLVCSLQTCSIALLLWQTLHPYSCCQFRTHTKVLFKVLILLVNILYTTICANPLLS